VIYAKTSLHIKKNGRSHHLSFGMRICLPQQPKQNTVTKCHRSTTHKHENHSILYQFPCIKTSINEHNKHPNGGPLVSPPSTHHGPYKLMILGHAVTPTYKSAIKLQHHTSSNCNSATTTIVDSGHPAVKHHLCQRYILLLEAPK
jgi:hypothetical protein